MGKVQFAVKNLINYELQKLSYAFNGNYARPTQLIISISNNCCLRCRMCGHWKSEYRPHDELTTEEWKRVLLEFKDWIKDSFYIQFTGGEPFLRNDMLELLNFASTHGIKTLVNSNGFLIDEDLAKRIAASGLNYLTISLDGVRPETFDALRGVRGAHKRVTSGILNANRYKRKGMIVGISSIVTDHNLDELIPLVRWGEENGIDRVGFHALQPHFNYFQQSKMPDPEWYKTSDLWVKDPEKSDRIIDKLIEKKAGGSPIINSIKHLLTMKRYYRDPYFARDDSTCMVGVNNIRIECDGGVRLCNSMEKIGNVREAPVRDIWNSPPAKKRRLEIKACNRRCTAKCMYTQSLMEKAKLFLFLAKKRVLE